MPWEESVLLDGHQCARLRQILLDARQAQSGTGRIDPRVLDAIAQVDAVGRRWLVQMRSGRGDMAERGQPVAAGHSDPGEFLETKDAAEILGCSIRTMTRRARSGDVPARRVGGVYMFMLDDLYRYQGERE